MLDRNTLSRGSFSLVTVDGSMNCKYCLCLAVMRLGLVGWSPNQPCTFPNPIWLEVDIIVNICNLVTWTCKLSKNDINGRVKLAHIPGVFCIVNRSAKTWPTLVTHVAAITWHNHTIYVHVHKGTTSTLCFI